MSVVIAAIGLMIGVAFNSWVPFGVATVIAFGWQWLAVDWLHHHFHATQEEL